MRYSLPDSLSNRFHRIGNALDAIESGQQYRANGKQSLPTTLDFIQCLFCLFQLTPQPNDLQLWIRSIPAPTISKSGVISVVATDENWKRNKLEISDNWFHCIPTIVVSSPDPTTQRPIHAPQHIVYAKFNHFVKESCGLSILHVLLRSCQWRVCFENVSFTLYSVHSPFVGVDLKQFENVHIIIINE